jgi:hypothetical protein
VPVIYGQPVFSLGLSMAILLNNAAVWALPAAMKCARLSALIFQRMDGKESGRGFYKNFGLLVHFEF